MPIDVEKFKSEGAVPAEKVLQENIMRVLEANPTLAFSAIELENGLNKRRQSIHQALRSLERQGKVKRGFVTEKKRSVCYVRLALPNEQTTPAASTVVAPEAETDVLQAPDGLVPKPEIPEKAKERKKGKRGKRGKSSKKR